MKLSPDTENDVARDLQSFDPWSYVHLFSAVCAAVTKRPITQWKKQDRSFFSYVQKSEGGSSGLAGILNRYFHLWIQVVFSIRCHSDSGKGGRKDQGGTWKLRHHHF